MENQYINLDEVAEALGVKMGTVQYYLRTLKIMRHKFPLDRKAYITEADFAKIKALKEQAGKRGEKENVA
jgi:hypothetical protein